MSLIRLALKAQGAAVGAVRRVLLHTRSAALVPADWPAPRGNFAVGVRDASVAGIGRLTSDGMVRVWYPARVGTGSGHREYFGDGTEQGAMIRGLAPLLSRRGSGRLGARTTVSLQDAEAIGSDHPVVFFSHGFGGFIGQNTHLCESLAAAGYVVVSVAYPKAAAAIWAPDGSSQFMTKGDSNRLMSDEFARTMLAVLRAKSAIAEDTALEQATTVRSLEFENSRWSAQLTAILDALVDPDERTQRVDGELLRVFDTADWSRIALVGMSFGGSTSANVAHVDGRVSAAVNLDGMQQGAPLFRQSIRVPLLLMTSGGAHMPSGRGIHDLHYEGEHPGALVRRVRVADAGHYGFTDLVELGRGPLRKLLDLGQVDGAKMLAQVSDEVLSFLGSTLHATTNPQTEQ